MSMDAHSQPCGSAVSEILGTADHALEASGDEHDVAPVSGEPCPPPGRLRRVIRASTMLISHLSTHLVHAATALIRLIPEVRRIDAAKEVRLKQLEADTKRDELTTNLALAVLAAQYSLVSTAFVDQPSSAELAEVIRALNPANDVQSPVKSDESGIDS